MAFTATEFIFDGIASSTYGLYIGGTNKNSTTSNGINFSTNTEVSGTGFKQMLLSVRYDAPMVFTLDIFSEEPMDNIMISKIQNWLCGRDGYKKLSIEQKDLAGIYFNCIIGSPKVTYIGNVARMLSVTVTCDSAFAYEVEKEISYSSSGWTFKNTSDHWDYLIPNSVEITCRGGDVKITNTADGRETIIKDRRSGEIITMCEETGVVKSSSGIKMIDSFNKKFIRFLPNDNQFTMQNVSSVKIKYEIIRKVVG